MYEEEQEEEFLEVEEIEKVEEEKEILPVVVNAITSKEILAAFENGGKQPITVNDCPVGVFSEVYVALKKIAVVGYDYDKNILTIK